MRRLLSVLFATVSIVAAFLGGTAFAQAENTIYLNAKILTVDANFSIAQSMAVREGRIIAVGSVEAVKQQVPQTAQIVDLGGRTVIPGLIDNHLHFIRSVWNYQREVRLDGIFSRRDALSLISARAKTVLPGSWITIIGGWSPNQFYDKRGSFTLDELDTVAPNNPIYIQKSYRTAYANSMALKAAGKNPANGAAIHGRRNFRAFNRFISWRNKSASSKAILTYMTALNRVGLTSVYDVGRPSEGKVEPLGKLAAKGPMPLRVFYTLKYRATDTESTDAALKLISQGSYRPLSADNQFGLIGLGEHIYGPMHDRPNRQQRWGESIWEPVRTIATTAAKNGWPIHEHTMSQVTISQFLELIAEIATHTPQVKELRWTLAHALGITESDLNRAKSLGVNVAIHSQAMMRSRSRNRPPLGSIARSGVLWGLGSDGGIVAPINPFLTLGWAVTGQNIKGEEAWSQDQRVSRKTALIAHTINNAKILFKEKDLGSLEIGKLADFVVLDGDYLTVPASKISKIQPYQTVVGGKVVYEQN